MKKITARDISKGELVVRNMSIAAQQLYNDSEPLTVAKMNDGTISIRGIYGDIDNMTIAEVEKMFEEIQEEK